MPVPIHAELKRGTLRAIGLLREKGRKLHPPWHHGGQMERLPMTEYDGLLAVDLVLRREDLDRAGEALAKAGFIRRRVAGIEMFLDGPDAKARDAVRVTGRHGIRPSSPRGCST